MRGILNAYDRCGTVSSTTKASTTVGGGMRGGMHKEVPYRAGVRLAVQSAKPRSTCYRFLLFVCVFVANLAALTLRPVLAEWDGTKGPNSGWYEAQEINPEARTRLSMSWKSCCAHSDVVKTRFRVSRESAEDEWWYLDGNQWRKVPSDIIHWNDPTPDGQPVLFVYSGQPTCFYPGDSGG